MTALTEDKFSILISIARQLKHCNSSQLAVSVAKIISVLKESKEIEVLQSILLCGFCKNYSKFNTQTLRQINSIFPNEKELKINDSITKSQLIPPIAKIDKNTIVKIDNKTEPLTFISIFV
eukprot:545646_1